MFIAAALMWVMIALACSERALADEPVLVARIGDRTLSVQQFEDMARELKQTGYSRVAQYNAEGKRTLLDGIIARQLLIMEGVRRGYDRDSTIQGTVDKSERKMLMMELYERQAVQPSYRFTEDELRAFFHEYQYDVEVLSQHIVCTSQERALEVLAALKAGAVFESLVGTYSTQNIIARFGPKGWVGWFKIGDVMEPLKEPLSTMPIGSLYPQPVLTAMGYHVFRLAERRSIEFSAARELMEKQALVQRRADDMERYVHSLRARYQLRCDEEALAKWSDASAYDRTLCTWEGGELTKGDYMDAVAAGSAHAPGSSTGDMLLRDADNLSGKQIMLAEARLLGLDRDETIRSRIDAERDKLIVGKLFRTEVTKRTAPISDSDVRAFYDDHIGDFTREDGKVTEFEFLRESIRTAMQNDAQNKAMDELLNELRQVFEGQVEIFPEGLDLAFSE